MDIKKYIKKPSQISILLMLLIICLTIFLLVFIFIIDAEAKTEKQKHFEQGSGQVSLAHSPNETTANEHGGSHALP